MKCAMYRTWNILDKFLLFLGYGFNRLVNLCLNFLKNGNKNTFTALFANLVIFHLFPLNYSSVTVVPPFPTFLTHNVPPPINCAPCLCP